MKAYDINETKIQAGIPVTQKPYPHIVLGAGGHKRATWIALGKRDTESIIRPRRVPCPNRGRTHYGEVLVGDELPKCEECGERYVQNDRYSRHPDTGEVDGPLCVHDVGIIAVKDKSGEPSGKFLIVAPRPGHDNRVLVLWRVSSGYRGSASISAGEGVTLIATDSSWHSGRGSLGETAEVLAILKPGQELTAHRSGRRVQETRARLVWDGKEIKVTFGDEALFAATSEEVEGEYL